MNLTVFNVRFRVPAEDLDTLVIEYAERKGHVTRLDVGIPNIQRISGSSGVIFQGDTAATLADSIVHANRTGRGMFFDADNHFLYMEAVKVEVDIGDPSYVRVVGPGPDNFVCIVSTDVQKGVAE